MRIEFNGRSIREMVLRELKATGVVDEPNEVVSVSIEFKPTHRPGQPSLDEVALIVEVR